MTKYKTSLPETLGRTNGQRRRTESTLVVTEFKCVSQITKEAGFNDSEIQCVSLVTKSDQTLVGQSVWRWGRLQQYTQANFRTIFLESNETGHLFHVHTHLPAILRLGIVLQEGWPHTELRQGENGTLDVLLP